MGTAVSDATPRVVFLARDRESSRMVYHGIRETCRVEAVVLETGPAAGRLIRGRLRRWGWRRTAGQLSFMGVNKVLALADRNRRRELTRRYGLCTDPWPAQGVIRVRNMNAGEAAGVLRRARPDAVVINGTRILSLRLLQSVEAPFLNLHLGLTPRYRGVYGGYWALAQGDPEHLGVTVHVVDEGVDTGGILYQERVAVEPDDTVNTIPLHQLAAGLPLLRRAVADAGRGDLDPRGASGPSRLWSHPTLGEYLRGRMRLGVR